MGNYDVIRQREIQHMSAGSRIRHSEYNASDSAEAHVLQIWIEPGKLCLRFANQKSVVMYNSTDWTHGTAFRLVVTTTRVSWVSEIYE